MSTESNSNNIKKITDNLTKVINDINKKAAELSEDNRLSPRERQKLQDQKDKLENKAFELKGLLISQKLDLLLDNNPQSPLSRIEQATNYLENAAQKVNEIGSFLSEIANAINMFADIIKAISTSAIVNI